MPTISFINLNSEEEVYIHPLEALVVSDELYAKTPDNVPVPLGIIGIAVALFVVLDWKITRLATVALLKSPVIRLPVPVNVRFPESVSDVNEPEAGVVLPIAAGAAQSAPSNKSALKFDTLVVLAITKGAVPVETVEVICPDACTVVNAPEAGVVAPTVPFKAPENLFEVKVVPSNVKSASSVNRPPVLAYVTRPAVSPESVIEAAVSEDSDIELGTRLPAASRYTAFSAG